ncbi:hypothetical protein CEXT_430101 [Caerostris extrusa]|uniref:Uncharacterized protein n=1 Tax=Caerostris extrusa TaxID=172846 RepID=A0AAV4U5G4_CAEEX|nr:hypothetical protein CEXT_430101 [Caerostris extrusa]
MGDERASFHLNPALTGDFIQRPRRAFDRCIPVEERQQMDSSLLSYLWRSAICPPPHPGVFVSLRCLPRHHAHLHDIQWEFHGISPFVQRGTEIMKAQSGLRKPMDPSLRIVTNPWLPTKSIRNK